MKIAYTFVISDLFHYGHLQLLEAAAVDAGKLICGILTDEAVIELGAPPISNFVERSSVIKAIRCVDEIIPQTSQDPFDNLCLLKNRFPDDEIVFVYGENWGESLGKNTINKLNITHKKQSFYKKLSNQNIACKFVEKYYPNLATSTLDTFTERFVVDDFDRFSKKKSNFSVSTKANTLQKLKPLLKKSYIEKMYVFTVADWQEYQNEILDDVKEKFEKNIVVRSSRLNEDTMHESKAGHFLSFLDIEPSNSEHVEDAISKVIASYPIEDRHLSDQILIQNYTDKVVMSGVLLTRDLVSNAPYYLINYDESEKTDTVTSGQEGAFVKIFKHAHRRILAPHWQKLLEAIDEIEHVIPGVPLDIEFALRKTNEIVIFQIRPLSANVNKVPVDENLIEDILKSESNRYHQKHYEEQEQLLGHSLILSDMAFWNPSELIGCQPSPLAYDLFDQLFMQRAWCNGLHVLGYNPIRPKPLMEKFCNKPYINVNLAFLALIPQAIPSQYHYGLYDYYLHKLKENPSDHDKVEFKILFTCYDFNLSNRLKELNQRGFEQQAIDEIECKLIEFTRSIIDKSESLFEIGRQKLISLEECLHEIKKTSISANIVQLLSACEELGTTHFATAARMAFIAEALLKSLVDQNVITLQEYQIIKQSLCTVAFEITQAASNVAKGLMTKDAFMHEYGHLRAGTYDISERRYDQSEHMLFEEIVDEHKVEIDHQLMQKLSLYLGKSPLKLSFDVFYTFIKNAIESREFVKLKFTKAISEILEQIKRLGEQENISHEDMAYLRLDEILNVHKASGLYPDLIAQRKRDFDCYKRVTLPAIIAKQEDFMVIQSFQSRPNFVTECIIQGEVVIVNKQTKPKDLNGKIVLIESADPGFHWILAHKIKGLVTKYGGMASHMSICCAELGIPAAIGCGEKFDELKSHRFIKMDCINQIIEKSHQ